MLVAEKPFLDRRGPAMFTALPPLLIAHRGGVVAPGAPENSLAAIKLAAAQGFDMVELDIRHAKDNEPVLFHGVGGRGSLWIDCGVNAAVADLTSQELMAITYLGTDQPILSLAQGLQACADLGLGVMLDLKGNDNPLTPTFLRKIGRLVEKHGLTHATVTISTHPHVREYLPESILFRLTEEDRFQLQAGLRDSLAGLFWFGGPEEIDDEEIHWYRTQGALVIPCINSFRYPHHSFGQLEATDIARLQAAGVDGFQIDADYAGHFAKLAHC